MTDLQTPLGLFREAWERAARLAPPGADHAAMVLATAEGSGRPSARVVLLRGFDDEGFLFFTNYSSRKAHRIEANAHAALCFHWHWLEEQVRVEGPVARATRAESNAYFESRPRGSQLGAWASRQSQPLASRDELEDRYRELARQFGDAPIPRPEFWGGYRLIPRRIEFWKAGEFRLHHRRVFALTADGWAEDWLFP